MDATASTEHFVLFVIISVKCVWNAADTLSVPLVVPAIVLELFVQARVVEAAEVHAVEEWGLRSVLGTYAVAAAMEDGVLGTCAVAATCSEAVRRRW